MVNPPKIVYDRLTKRFEHIERGLKPELKTELDCLLSDLAAEIDALPKFFARGVIDLEKKHQKELLEERTLCASAVCPGCYEGIPRSSESGREIHTDGSAIFRCAANGIWAMGTGVIPKVTLPQLIPINQDIKLKSPPDKK